MKNKRGFAPILITLIVAGILVLGGSSYYLWRKSSSYDDSWKKYENEEYGFQFSHPQSYMFAANPSCGNLTDGSGIQPSCLVSLDLAVSKNDFDPAASFYLLKGINYLEIPGQISTISFDPQRDVWTLWDDSREQILSVWDKTKSGQDIVKVSNGGSHASFYYYLIPDYVKDTVAVFQIPQGYRLRCDLIEDQSRQAQCGDFYKSAIDEFKEEIDTWLPGDYLKALYADAEAVVKSFSFSSEGAASETSFFVFPRGGERWEIGKDHTIEIKESISEPYPFTHLTLNTPEGDEVGVVYCKIGGTDETIFFWDTKSVLNYCGAGLENKMKEIEPGDYVITATKDVEGRPALAVSEQFSLVAGGIAGWQIYRNEKYGVEFEYPYSWVMDNYKGWLSYDPVSREYGHYYYIINASNGFKGSAQDESDDPCEPGVGRISSTVGRFSLRSDIAFGTQKSLEEIVNFLIENPERGMAPAVKPELIPVTVDGREALKIEERQGKCREERYYIKQSSELYATISLFVYKGGEDERVIDRILSTFNFLQ